MTHPEAGWPRWRGAGTVLETGTRPVLDVAQLCLRGELDAETGPALLEAVAHELGVGRNVVCIDLAHVIFCDVQGLRALLWAARRLDDAGGHVILKGPSRLVRMMAEVAGWADELGL